MSAFVEECRREWKRLGVPDSIADEMASELTADLAEASADGVSEAEMLGESDPRRFAATWADERGLISERRPKKRRKRLRVWVAVGFVLVFFLGVAAAAGLVATATVSVHTVSAPQPVRSVMVPSFVGLKACHAERIALAAGLEVHKLPERRCNAVVIGQWPVQGTIIPWRLRGRTTVKLRLSRARS